MSNIILKNRVLVVDDDEVINQVLTAILTKEFSVDSYFSAEDALKDTDFRDYDVILTDVNLPGISGIDLLTKIKNVDENIPVIIITGMTYIDVAISALKNGATDFIQKPFYNDQLVLAVKRAQERKKLMIENIELVNQLQEKNSELEILNKKIKFRNEQMEHDLDIASNLQSCLFPLSFPDIENFSFAIRFKPVEKISGDFFEVIENNNDTFVLIFADISGHGVPAALFSAMVKAAITSLDHLKTSPSEQIAEINQFLLNSQKKLSYNYATLCYLFFDIPNKKIIYSNAGIPAPVLIRDRGDVVTLAPNGPFVGIFEGAEYKDEEVTLEKGDKLVLFTDGLYEGLFGKDVYAGYQMTYDLIEKIKKQGIEDIISRLYLNATDSANSNDDDITVMGLKYNNN